MKEQLPLVLNFAMISSPPSKKTYLKDNLPNLRSSTQLASILSNFEKILAWHLGESTIRWTVSTITIVFFLDFR